MVGSTKSNPRKTKALAEQTGRLCSRLTDPPHSSLVPKTLSFKDVNTTHSYAPENMSSEAAKLVLNKCLGTKEARDTSRGARQQQSSGARQHQPRKTHETSLPKGRGRKRGVCVGI